jgi:hypothetical protein
MRSTHAIFSSEEKSTIFSCIVLRSQNANSVTFLAVVAPDNLIDPRGVSLLAVFVASLHVIGDDIDRIACDIPGVCLGLGQWLGYGFPNQAPVKRDCELGSYKTSDEGYHE